MSASMEREAATQTAGVRQRALCAAMRAGRRAVHGTPLQGSSVTTSLSAALHRLAFPVGGRRVRVPYRGLWFTMADGERCTAAGLLSGRHEQLELDLFETFSAHASHVLDIGASIGLYSCSGAAALPSSGRLTAFEPGPPTSAHCAETWCSTSAQTGYESKPLRSVPGPARRRCTCPASTAAAIRRAPQATR